MNFCSSNTIGMDLYITHAESCKNVDGACIGLCAVYTFLIVIFVCMAISSDVILVLFIYFMVPSVGDWAHGSCKRAGQYCGIICADYTLEQVEQHREDGSTTRL